MAALGLASAAQAHTVLTHFFVDGQGQGWGTCIRYNLDGLANHPIPAGGINSGDMACGVDGEVGRERVCPINAGSTLTFEYRSDPSDPNSMILHPSHKGPCSVWMKKVESAMADNNAAGEGWFKIWEDMDAAVVDGELEMCTSRLIKEGTFSATIPSDIEEGYYLLRTELTALHGAWEGKPEWYPHCAQVYVEGGGSAKPQTISIPENYLDMSMEGLNFNVGDDNPELPYPRFGPEPYASDSGEDNIDDEDSSDEECEVEYDNDYSPPETSSGEIEGQKPEGCVAEVANWCGMEVRDYDDRETCWDVADECWALADECWDVNGASGSQGCVLWGEKCEGINESCQNEVFPGPPNKGEMITSPPENLGSSKIRRQLDAVMQEQSHAMRHVTRDRAQ